MKKYFKYIALAGVIGFGAMTYVNAHNHGVTLEESIKGQYSQNQNKLSEMSRTILEAAQVPDIAKKDLIEVIEAGLKGRYGKNGASSMVVAVKEAYPGAVDPALYTKLQTLVEAKRADFSNEQKLLIEKVRIYNTELRYAWSGTWLKIAGFPTINLEKYKPVVSTYAKKAFETKEDSGLKLR